MKKHVSRYFKHPKLQQLMEFPVLFLGAQAKNIPALYSLMNYADIKLGTWFPIGGMHKIVEGMHRLAVELGVQFEFNTPVTKIRVENNRTSGVEAGDKFFPADVVISGADYHHTDTQFLDPQYQNYSEEYWNKRTMAPSCLLYYIGLDTTLDSVPHHSLFFDADFEIHAKEIYENPDWPQNPLFYVSRVTATDPALAPPGKDNLFFLIPVAAGLFNDSVEIREKFFNLMAERFEKRTGYSIRKHVIYRKDFAVSDFASEYGAYKGNAYGLANTLRQTAIWKPSCKNKKIKNLYYTGQLTVPGPGVPPSLISGEVVAKLVNREQGK
jgi:phytoene desaturase